VLGTWHVLLAAEAARISRVIYLSSGKALGMLERAPDYLPIDDEHRGRPTSAYGLSKWLAEEMCAAFTERTGVDTFCLRPVAVYDAEGYECASRRSPDARASGDGWSMGVHIDLRDVASAILKAIDSPARGHQRLLLCAADTDEKLPTRELVARHMPRVPWRGGAEFDRDPYRALVDVTRAANVLGWKPQYRWPGRRA
jgi:UDP-glucose 4-epimerase